MTAVLLLAGGWSTLCAQDNGTAAGVVVSTWDGSPLAGATVTVRGTTLAATTDANGRYQLNGVPPGEQALRFSKSGFASATVTDVRVVPGQATTVNGNLRPEFHEMEEYEVTAEEFTQQSEQIMFERQQSSAMLDAIGSDQFARLGAGDAAEALGKVAGASIADGKFAVIRGLADRYTSTTLNRADIPSADPDRKAAQLDLFPAQFISRLDVSKTFAPDMGGGFAGGAIDIVTRSFPDKFLFGFSLGTSYNTQASLNDDFLVNDQGSTDWLAKDDGTRALPASAAATPPSGTANQLDPAIKDDFKSRQFAPVPDKSPLNSSLSLMLGDTQTVFGRRVGYLAGLNYKTDYQHYSDGSVVKDSNFSDEFHDVDKVDVKSTIEYTWGALASVTLELIEHHEIGFSVLYVQSAEDEARRLRGKDSSFGATPDDDYYVDQSIMSWTERNLTYYQLRGGHELPELNNLRLDWVGAMSSTTQEEPDQRIFQFLAQPSDSFYTPNGPSQPSRPARFWRELSDDNDFIRGDLTIPLPSYTSKDNTLKTGVSYSQSTRDYLSRAFDVRSTTSHPFYTTGDPNIYLAPENEPYISYYNFIANFAYQGEQQIGGYYLMADWSALEWLRLTGGARLENTELQVQNQNLSKNQTLPSTDLSERNLLPSLSATINLSEKVALRAAWSSTVVRPTYREVSLAEIYDVAQGRTYRGNPDLQLSTSDNFDLRAEWYPRAGSLLSGSVFYKKIKGPIEQTPETIQNDLIFFENYDQADVYGVEVEIRENLGSWWSPLKEFSLGFNAAYIKSEVALTAQQQDIRGDLWLDDADTRPLYDQPEFVINGDLTWEHATSGTSVTLSGGVVGRRLVLVGLATPDEYEEPAPQLDVFISQKLGKHWKAKLFAKNLLDPTYDVTQEWPGYGKLVIESYTKGITLGLSVSCEF